MSRSVGISRHVFACEVRPTSILLKQSLPRGCRGRRCPPPWHSSADPWCGWRDGEIPGWRGWRAREPGNTLRSFQEGRRRNRREKKHAEGDGEVRSRRFPGLKTEPYGKRPHIVRSLPERPYSSRRPFRRPAAHPMGTNKRHAPGPTGPPPRFSTRRNGKRVSSDAT